MIYFENYLREHDMPSLPSLPAPSPDAGPQKIVDFPGLEPSQAEIGKWVDLIMAMPEKPLGRKLSPCCNSDLSEGPLEELSRRLLEEGIV